MLFPSEKKDGKLMSLFQYYEYLEEHSLFIMKDGSLGAVFELEAPSHEPMGLIELQSLSKTLGSWLSLGSDIVFQLMSHRRPIAIGDFNDRFNLSAKPESLMGETLRQERLQMFQSMVSDKKVYETKTYLSFRFCKKQESLGLAKRLVNDAINFTDFYVEDIEKRSREVLDQIDQIKAISKIEFKSVDAHSLREICRRVLVGESSDELPSISKNVSLGEQILFEPIKVNSSGLAGKRKSKTVSLLAPSSIYEGAGANFLSLEGEYVVSISCTTPTKRNVLSKLGLKEWCLSQSRSARSEKQKNEIKEVRKKIADGDECIHLNWNITVLGEEEDSLRKTCNKIKAWAINKFDCSSVVEEDVGEDLFRSSLPLHFCPKSEWGINRFIPVHISEAKDLLPVFCNFKGSKTPLQVFENRSGEVFGFSGVDGQTSQHGVLLGDTGSGKDFFANNLITGFKNLEKEPIVFVFDYNTSQTIYAKLYNGQIDSFTLDKAPSCSVFRGVYDEKKIDVIVSWISEAIRLTNSDFRMQGEHTECLSRSIRMAYQKKVNSKATTFVEGHLVDTPLGENVILNMDDIATELAALPGVEGLEKYTSAVEELLVKTASFYGDGHYAEYFRPDEEAPEYTEMFYVLDFEQVKSSPVHLTLNILASFELVRQVRLKEENEGREIWSILNEVAVFGRDCPLLARHFVNKSETSRKDAFWIWGITNRPNSFFETELCRALWEVSEHFGFLPMSDLNVDKLVSCAGENNFTEADVENIKSLEIVEGEYGEFYYMNKKKTTIGVGINRPSRSQFWQTPTNMKRKLKAVKALEKFQGDGVKALDYLLETEGE